MKSLKNNSHYKTISLQGKRSNLRDPHIPLRAGLAMTVLLGLLSITNLTAFAEVLPKVPQNLMLTSTTQEQLDPEYWIKRIPNAEVPVKTSAEMDAFNDYIDSLIRERVDVLKMAGTRAGKEVRADLSHVYYALKARKLYDVDNKDVPVSFFEEQIKPIVDWERIPSQIKVKWGAVIRSTSVRAVPTDTKVLEKPYDIEFDQFQFTLIKPWTPVAILHHSSDDKWLYVQAPYARGWVKTKDIAYFSGTQKLKTFVHSSKFLVTTGNSIPVYRSIELSSELKIRASMGTIFPLVSTRGNLYVVRVPVKSEKNDAVIYAYISKESDVSSGYLPYSQANMIRQAFKLRGARYGWGGMYGGRDCSGFTHDVFLSLGVDMPRGSLDQAFVGTKLGFYHPFKDKEAKEDILHQARPGITIMAMHHHLMLYIGEVNEQFYAIHCTWAERISMSSDEKNRINQVVVTDLTLNGQSYLGSLFDRIVSINEVD